MSAAKQDFTKFSTKYPNYFPGQYLLEEDFKLQHKYLSDRQKYANQSLSVSGITEGLEVVVNREKTAITIKPGAAIDSHGNLIVLKAEQTLADFGELNQGEVYIQYAAKEDALQQEDNKDSYTRWAENPQLEFAATTPEQSVKLAKLNIKAGKIELDLSIREYSGLSLPNSGDKALTLRSAANGKLNLAVLSGSLKVDEDLIVEGTISGKIDAKNITSGVLSIEQIPQINTEKITWGKINGQINIINQEDNTTGNSLILGEAAKTNLSLGYSQQSTWIQSYDNKPLTINPTGKSNVAIGAEDPGDYQLHVEGNQRISENLTVNGTIYAGGNPAIYENYEIYLKGSAAESLQGNDTFLKIANIDMGMTKRRGINTVILNANGTFKNKKSFDVYGSVANWNEWADWINTNAVIGDVVTVASFDALAQGVRKIPANGSARTLITNIRANQADRIGNIDPNKNFHGRNPYTLLFIKGQSTCVEILQPHKGNNAHLKTTYYQLLTLSNIIKQQAWQTPSFKNKWVNYGNGYNSAAYFQDSLGIVHLRGLVKNGARNSIIFTLPDSYRPSMRELHVVQTSGNAIGRIDIMTNGDVLVYEGSSTWISLDGITFRAK